MNQGLEPFEFIGIGSGSGSPFSNNKITVPVQFWFFDKKKVKVPSVPDNLDTEKYNNF